MCGVGNLIVLSGLGAWKWLLIVLTCCGPRDTAWFPVLICVNAGLYVPHHTLSPLMECDLLDKVVLICACIKTLDTTMLELSLGPV